MFMTWKNCRLTDRGTSCTHYWYVVIYGYRHSNADNVLDVVNTKTGHVPKSIWFIKNQKKDCH